MSSTPDPYRTPKAALMDVQREEWDYAGFWIRFVGYLIDGVLVLLCTALLALVGVESVVTSSDTDVHIEPPLWLLALYFIGFWIWRAGTPGKLLFGIRVVDANTGAKARWWQYVVRFVVSIISAIPFALGYFWVAFNERKRAWHDYAAGTVVVRWDMETTRPVSAPDGPAGPGFRCVECGHRIWVPRTDIPEKCVSCGRTGTYVDLESDGAA